jgi:hypothetical protein
MVDDRTTQEIEPFSYFPTHASAIGGLGGPESGPDPNYCFHTPYLEYRPGVVLVKVRLSSARATEGELAIRVHAYRPDSAFDIALVAGTRVPLVGLDGSDVEVTIRIAAIPNVQYALYGYFSEASDLSAARLSILAEEVGGDGLEDFVSMDMARSLFETASVDFPNRLMADDEPRFAHPVSQPMTTGQIASAEYVRGWPSIPVDGCDHSRRWPQVFALQVLLSFGMLGEGPSGLLMAGSDLPIADTIRARGGLLTELLIRTALVSDSDGGGQRADAILASDVETIGGQFDFVAAITQADWFACKSDFFTFITVTLRRLLRGGIAVFLFDYDTDADRQCARPVGQGGFSPRRGEIEQLALRIISHGSDVAQLSFPEGIGTMDVCPFGLIVRR